MGEEPWRTGPWQAKRIVDRYMAEGVNHFVLHTSAHQPFTDRKPGMTLRQYGQHLSRNETWAESEMRAWTDYLSRSAWMLRQGKPGADIAWFYGEGAAAALPLLGGRTAGSRRRATTSTTWTPRAWSSGCRPGRGARSCPSGVAYRALVIPRRVDRLSLLVLRKLDRPGRRPGGLVIGERPGRPRPACRAARPPDAEWRTWPTGCGARGGCVVRRCWARRWPRPGSRPCRAARLRRGPGSGPAASSTTASSSSSPTPPTSRSSAELGLPRRRQGAGDLAGRTPGPRRPAAYAIDGARTRSG